MSHLNCTFAVSSWPDVHLNEITIRTCTIMLAQATAAVATVIVSNTQLNLNTLNGYLDFVMLMNYEMCDFARNLYCFVVIQKPVPPAVQNYVID